MSINSAYGFIGRMPPMEELILSEGETVKEFPLLWEVNDVNKSDQVVQIVKKIYNELARTRKFKTTEKAHRFKMTVLRYGDAKKTNDVHATRIALDFRQFKLKEFIKDENDLKIVQDWVDSILNSFDNEKAEKTLH